MIWWETGYIVDIQIIKTFYSIMLVVYAFFPFLFFIFFWLLKTIDNNDILVINVNDPRMQVIHNFIIIQDKTRHDIVVVVNWFLEFLLCMDLLLFCKKKKTPLFQFIRILHVDLVIDQNGNHNIWLILLIVTTVDFDFDSLVL